MSAVRPPDGANRTASGASVAAQPQARGDQL